MPNDLKSKELLTRGVKSSEILKGNSNLANQVKGNKFLIPSKFEILSVKMFNLEESLNHKNALIFCSLIKYEQAILLLK